MIGQRLPTATSALCAESLGIELNGVADANVGPDMPAKLHLTACVGRGHDGRSGCHHRCRLPPAEFVTGVRMIELIDASCTAAQSGGVGINDNVPGSPDDLPRLRCDALRVFEVAGILNGYRDARGGEDR